MVSYHQLHSSSQRTSATARPHRYLSKSPPEPDHCNSDLDTEMADDTAGNAATASPVDNAQDASPLPYSDRDQTSPRKPDQGSSRNDHSSSLKSNSANNADENKILHDQWKEFHKAYEHADHPPNTALDIIAGNFLTDYVPSDGTAPPRKTTSFLTKLKRLASLVPTEGSEKLTYPPLIDLLNACQEGFDELHRISFSDTSSSLLFPGSTHVDHGTKPDISGAYPGTKVPNGCANWVKYCLTIQVKVNTDPVIREPYQWNYNEYVRETMAQIVKDAKSLLYSSSSNCVFVIGVYTRIHKIRIFRFDRSGSVSCAFDYLSNPELLRTFLWKLSHPCHKVPNTVVGCDETIRIPKSPAHIDQMKKIILKWKPDFAEEFEQYRDNCRWVRVRVVKDHKLCGGIKASAEDSDIAPEVDTPSASAKPNTSAPTHTQESTSSSAKASGSVTSEGTSADKSTSAEQQAYVDEDDEEDEFFDVYGFTFGKPLHKSSGLVSRATYVTRMMILVDDHWYAVVAKDSWHQTVRHPERLFYRRMIRRFPDLVESPQYNWVKEIYGEDTTTIPGVARYYGYLDLSKLVDLSGTPEERGHITSSRGNPKAERSRSRILTSLGEKIVGFNNTKELVTSLRDAIVGHYIARCCGILHRDISVGNILMSRGENGVQGFIHDFDFAALTKYDLEREGEKVDEDVDEFKTLTGTRQFLAIGILNGLPHDTQHDIESFYWVLAWTLLRHKLEDHARSEAVFDEPDNFKAKNEKRGWLVGETLPLPDNVPLNKMMEKLRLRFLKAISTPEIDEDDDEEERKDKAKAKLILHEEIVKVLNTWLRAEGWPTDDKSIPFNGKKRDDEGTESAVKKSRGVPGSSAARALFPSKLSQAHVPGDADADHAVKPKTKSTLKRRLDQQAEEPESKRSRTSMTTRSSSRAVREASQGNPMATRASTRNTGEASGSKPPMDTRGTSTRK